MERSWSTNAWALLSSEWNYDVFVKKMEQDDKENSAFMTRNIIKR